MSNDDLGSKISKMSDGERLTLSDAIGWNNARMPNPADVPAYKAACKVAAKDMIARGYKEFASMYWPLDKLDDEAPEKAGPNHG